MYNYKVFIPSAGIGSRLEGLTKHVNKALVTVGLKPSISHIIEKFEDNIEIVVALGYKGDDLKDFLELAYPNKKFTFVNIDPFDGPGSGLGLSIMKCEEHLQCPFIFIPNDCIVDGQIPVPDNNWIGYYISDNKEQYRCLEIKDEKVINLLEKKEHKESSHPYIGLAGIHEYRLFWNEMNKGDRKIVINQGESYGLREMLNKVHVKAIKFNWFDTGNLNALNKTRDHCMPKNAPNILPKSDEAIWFIDNHVIKFHRDEKFISQRVNRIKYLKQFVPNIIDSRNHFYKYYEVNGEIFSKKAWPYDFEKLMHWLKDFWIRKKLTNDEEIEFKKGCMKFYRDKTYERVRKYFENFNKEDKEETINGIKIPKVLDILDSVDWGKISEGIATNFHGDLHFENILISKEGKEPYTLLDWRQNFNGNIEYGDIYYDLAKINHGLIMNHGLLSKGLFTLNINHNNIEFDMHRRFNLVLCERYLKKYCIENNYDYNKIEIMTFLVYLNSSPLHHYPDNEVYFYLGKMGLFEVMNRK